jgi:uncharacterized integral membrane protein (TIGR00697 family)
MGLLAPMGQLAVALPPAPGWTGQESFARVFGLVPRFAAGSLIAYWAGEFTNSYTMAKLKLATGGRWLWTRTAGSTISGQAVDTTIFTTIAFWGSQRGGMGQADEGAQFFASMARSRASHIKSIIQATSSCWAAQSTAGTLVYKRRKLLPRRKQLFHRRLRNSIRYIPEA